jgi:hypothetical protein
MRSRATSQLAGIATGSRRPSIPHQPGTDTSPIAARRGSAAAPAATPDRGRQRASVAAPSAASGPAHTSHRAKKRWLSRSGAPMGRSLSQP